nr:RecName: Full=80 kDa cell wall protein [Solanum lycopersicum]
STHTSDFLKL